ncbi:MAG: ABC transporter ATP-binding protein [Anaerolineae bacterium]|nr:ABC transporter ATP-binding protein [Anaerolineae bacterium]
MEHAIEFHDISKYFYLRHERPRSFHDLALNLWRPKLKRQAEQYWILQNVSFVIDRAEVVGLIGANGVGKSSILKLISHIIEPTSGRISVNGRVSALLELGAGFHPDLTGRENIFLNGAILGMPRQQLKKRFDSIVQFAGLERFIDIPLRHYSSGMYMRLGFSVAIHVDPEILLIDEVLAVGDHAFQGRCLDKVQELVRQGVAILFVSHDMKAVRSLCDRTTWLDAGQIRLQGDTEQVVNAYLQGMTEEEQAELSLRKGRLNQGRRWGSYEAAITDVVLLDRQGSERYTFESGEAMTIRISYQCRQKIKNPVFGLAIFRSDGWQVNGPNTRFSNYEIGEISGSGYIDYHVECLPLLGGAYQISAAIADHSLEHTFDHQERCFTFIVQNSCVKEEFGCVYIPARWEHHMPSGSYPLVDWTNSEARK